MGVRELGLRCARGQLPARYAALAVTRGWRSGRRRRYARARELIEDAAHPRTRRARARAETHRPRAFVGAPSDGERQDVVVPEEVGEVGEALSTAHELADEMDAVRGEAT